MVEPAIWIAALVFLLVVGVYGLGALIYGLEYGYARFRGYYCCEWHTPGSIEREENRHHPACRHHQSASRPEKPSSPAGGTRL
jgi:hypothetical protein